MIRDVWFWLPMHMLQAYPMCRNLPIPPDFLLPFAHLIWAIAYISEHWTGLAEPVEIAFEWSAKFIVPIMGILLLSHWYFTMKLTNNKTVVTICMVLYFAFMFGSKSVGLIGSPKKTYEDQIAANADDKWNDHHVILHVYYLVMLWVSTLTVPYEKLAATRGGTNGLSPEDPTNLKSAGISVGEVLSEALAGAKLLPNPDTLSKTSRSLILQGVVYFSTGLLLFFAPGVFNKMMMFPEPFTAAETPMYRTVGFCVIGIGYFYIMASRMNNNYWAVATIFTRMTMTPVCCMGLFIFFGGAPQLCITFSILDPTLAFLTYKTMQKEELAKKNK